MFIQLAPKTGPCIAIKGQRNIYQIAPGNEKSNLTFIGTFCANGNIVKPTIIFPYVKIP